MQITGDFKCMVAATLNLKEPWYIKGTEADAEKMRVHIYVGVRDGARFACPECGRKAT